jgi:peptidoglycan/LPS O-acetylase OafA/YrhL
MVMWNSQNKIKSMRGSNLKEERLDYVDSLRGVAILLVIIVHTGQSISNIAFPLKSLTRFGQMGVQLFFVLSALTMCMSLSRVNLSLTEIYKFYIRRFFRIAPLYYVGIVFYFFYHGVNNYLETHHAAPDEQYTLGNIMANVFFVHGFIPDANNNIVPGGWSIGTEMTFYLIFPLLFLLFKKSSNLLIFTYPPMGLLFSFVLISLISAEFNLPAINNDFLYYNLFNLLPVFLLGIFYFFVLKNSNKFYLFPNKISLLFFTAVFFILSLVSFTFYFQITFTPFLCGVTFILLIDVFKYYQILNNAILVKIGQLSFSMYIFHFVFAWPVSRILNKLLSTHLNPEITFLICLIVTITGTFMAAIFSEKMIEKPGIKIGKMIIQKKLVEI